MRPQPYRVTPSRIVAVDRDEALPRVPADVLPHLGGAVLRHGGDQLVISGAGPARAYDGRRFSAHQIAMTACSPTAGQSATPAIRDVTPEEASTVTAPTL